MFFYEIWYSIFLYGAAGWLLQVIYAAVKQKQFVNRGFLLGPVCPLYGVVIAAVLLIAGGPERNLFLLILLSLILVMALEWLTGWLSVRLFGLRCWDYSGMPGNVEGYFCPPFSLGWAIVCALTVRFLHPYLRQLLSLIPVRLGIIVLAVLTVFVAADLWMSIRCLKQLEPRLIRLQELMGDREKVSARQGKKYQGLLQSFGSGERRLFRAFPTMKHLKYQSELEQIRIEVMK